MHPRQHPNLIVRQEDEGKFLIYNRDNETPLVLNESSYSILNLCDGSRSVEQIQETLIRSSDSGLAKMDREQLKEIVEDHLHLMRKLQIITN